MFCFVVSFSVIQLKTPRGNVKTHVFLCHESSRIRSKKLSESKRKGATFAFAMRACKGNVIHTQNSVWMAAKIFFHQIDNNLMNMYNFHFRKSWRRRKFFPVILANLEIPVHDFNALILITITTFSLIFLKTKYSFFSVIFFCFVCRFIPTSVNRSWKKFLGGAPFPQRQFSSGANENDVYVVLLFIKRFQKFMKKLKWLQRIIPTKYVITYY